MDICLRWQQYFSVLVYGFLTIVASITTFHIINSIAMSVAARNKQYGMMRAIGLDNRQLRRMITAEAMSYAFMGCIVGLGIGIPLHCFFFQNIITAYFGDQWQLPFPQLLIILLVVLGAAAIAVCTPIKHLENMSITETINEL